MAKRKHPRQTQRIRKTRMKYDNRIENFILHEYLNKESFISRILLYLVGVTPEISNSLSSKTKRDLHIMAIMIFIPALLAFGSGVIAFRYLTDSVPARIGGAMLFSAIILLIDLGIFNFIDTKKRTSLLIGGVSRLVLILLLSVLLAEPIIIQSFSGAIHKHIVKNQTLAYQEEIKRIDDALLIENSERVSAKTKYLNEVGGHISGRRGEGTIAKGLKQDWMQEETDYKLKEMLAKREKDSLGLAFRASISPETLNQADLSIMLQNVKSLESADSSVSIITWLLRFVLILIDLIPVLLKFSTDESFWEEVKKAQKRERVVFEKVNEQNQIYKEILSLQRIKQDYKTLQKALALQGKKGTVKVIKASIAMEIREIEWTFSQKNIAIKTAKHWGYDRDLEKAFVAELVNVYTKANDQIRAVMNGR